MTMYRMINGISDWSLFLHRIPDVENLMRSGKLIDKLPEKRYHSATEMRNA